ncbi:MAG: dynamin family protein [Methylococcus sp.]
MSNNEMTPSDALYQARNLIGQIQEQLTQLYEIVPYLEENPTLHENVEQTRALFLDAEELLRHPHLRIATIGTTSSGKSTLVNAMVGRRIAPMDAGELSAGILHLVHADRHRLHIKPVEGLWDEVDVPDLSDGAMYQHVREKVFKVFHEAKTKRTIRVPEVRIEGPLLATAPELLGLPEEVGVEIFDLPGLNSVQDQDNMKVIQHYLQDCFSIVVMHYGQTDKASREKLLREVKRVVDAMRGRTDATLFVLNRTDERKKDDDPLEVRLGEFASAIQHTLELQEPPTLLPISALPLFYGQSAWGTSYPWSKDAGLLPLTEPKDWLANFQYFSDDCAGLIRNHTKERADIREWFNDRYDPDSLSVGELRQWLHWTWKWSHGFEFWQELRERVANRFPEIVIGPVLIKPLPSLHALLAQLAQFLEIQRLENHAAIIERQERLKAQFEAMNIFLIRKKSSFKLALKKR